MKAAASPNSAAAVSHWTEPWPCATQNRDRSKSSSSWTCHASCGRVGTATTRSCDQRNIWNPQRVYQGIERMEHSRPQLPASRWAADPSRWVTVGVLTWRHKWRFARHARSGHVCSCFVAICRLSSTEKRGIAWRSFHRLVCRSWDKRPRARPGSSCAALPTPQSLSGRTPRHPSCKS